MTETPRTWANLAIDLLLQGGPEEFALLVEEGNPSDLSDMAEELANNPQARTKIARALRTGKLLRRGEKNPDIYNLYCRESFLFNRVAYWIGRGFDDRWQDSKDSTVWHFAAEEWGNGEGANIFSNRPFPLPGLKASSLEKAWRDRASNRCLVNNQVLTLSFWKGVADEMSDVDDPITFIEEQMNTSQRWGFHLEDSISLKNDLLKYVKEAK